MSDDLSIEGTIDETTVPDLVRSLIRSNETATLTLEAYGHIDTLYFRDGKLVSAGSTDSDMGLAETLLRSGELNLQQYHQAMDEIVVSQRIGALLVESGYLQSEDLVRAVERQASAIVLNAIGYRSGSYKIDFNTEVPDEIITIPLSTETLILDGVRHVEYWSLIMRGIGRMERLLEQVADADSRSFHLELRDEESHVLSLLSEPQSVEALCARSYLTNFVTCRALWGLLAVNLIQDAQSEVVDGHRAAVETEYELEALVERYNGVFQKVFGLVFQKIGDHVYDFMDRVVLQLSPETLPYLSGMSLINEGRVDFDQLLTNMISSGTNDQSAVINRVLNELLWGWIFEVRKDFGGTPLEAEIARVMKSVR